MTLTKVWSVLKFLVKHEYLTETEAKVIFDKIIEDKLYRTLNSKPKQRKQESLFDEEIPF